MRLQDGGDALRVLRLAAGQPAELRHGLGGLRYGPHGLGPGLPSAEPVDQVRGGGLRPPVVAQQRGAYEVALVVQRYQTVLLRGHTDGLDAFEEPPGGSLTEGEEPRLRVHLRGLGLDGMRGVPLPQHRTGVRVADDDVSEGG